MNKLLYVFRDFQCCRRLLGGKWQYQEIQGWTIYEGMDWVQVTEFNRDAIRKEEYK